MKQGGFRGRWGITLTALLFLNGCSGDRPKETAGIVGPDPAAIFTEKPPAPGPSLPAQPPTDNPWEILRRMVAAYKHLDTAHIASTVDGEYTLTRAQKTYQTTITRYQKQPPRIALYVKDPRGGTQTLVSDGQSLVYHRGVSNRYVRYTYRGDMATACKGIEAILLQLFSPIVFLRSGSLPPGVESARLAGEETVEGGAAYVVRGSVSSAYLREIGDRLFTGEIRPLKGEFTLWVDRQNYLLRKLSVELSWHVRAKRRDGRWAEVTPRIKIRERLTNVQNPRFAQDTFRFLPPKGAKEIPIESAAQFNPFRDNP